MKASERKLMEIRALSEASAEALVVVAKASQERQAKRRESRKLAAKVPAGPRQR